MLRVHEASQGWFEQTVEFAKRIGLYEQPPPVIKEGRLWEAKNNENEIIRVMDVDNHTQMVWIKPLAKLVSSGMIAVENNVLCAKQYLVRVPVSFEDFRAKYVPRYLEQDDKNYFKRWLDYLHKYADPNGAGLTECVLAKDSAPASFEFTMKQAFRARKCRSCGHRWSSRVQLSSNTPNLSGEATEFCPHCSERGVSSEPIHYEYWFNGGLIYHGSHDGWGSGAGPTFAVTLTPTSGWSVHT